MCLRWPPSTSTNASDHLADFMDGNLPPSGGPSAHLPVHTMGDPHTGEVLKQFGITDADTADGHLERRQLPRPAATETEGRSERGKQAVIL